MSLFEVKGKVHRVDGRGFHLAVDTTVQADSAAEAADVALEKKRLTLIYDGRPALRWIARPTVTEVPIEVVLRQIGADPLPGF